MCRLLIAVVSLVAEYLLMGMQASVVFMCRLSNCGTRAMLPEACGIFPDGDIGRIDCIGIRIVNHWTTTRSLPPAPGIPTAMVFSSYFTIFFLLCLDSLLIFGLYFHVYSYISTTLIV